MSYTFPSATINFITYTAKRWGQFPTITYITGGIAGSEIVTISPDLSNITIKIQGIVSTNTQIIAAINSATNYAVQSLYARDLISATITSGHESDTNTAVSATPLTSAQNTPVEYPIALVLPELPSNGINTVKMEASASLSVDTIYKWPEAPASSKVAQSDASGNISWVAMGGGASFPLLAPAGSNGAPSYSFVDYPTLGIYEDGGDLVIGKDGGESIRCSSNVVHIGGTLSILDIGSPTNLSIEFAADPGSGFFSNGGGGFYALTGGEYAFTISEAGGNDSRFFLFDKATSTFTRVRFSANDAVIGITGRVLYVDNI